MSLLSGSLLFPPADAPPPRVASPGGIPVLAALVLVTAAAIAALIVVWWLGAETARSGVDDVSRSLRGTILNNTMDQVYKYLALPFLALDSAMQTMGREGFNIERSDGIHLIAPPGSRRGCTNAFVELCQLFPEVSGFYLGNEYGHMCSVMCLTSTAAQDWLISTQPPIDQLRRGVPTWTIPCRFRADCAKLYSAASPRMAAHCEDPVDPWPGQEACGAQQVGCRPYWAAGCGGWGGRIAFPPESWAGCDSAALPCYTPLQPRHATWATACSPSSPAGAACDPSADAPRGPCPASCPQFNRTYYLAGDGLSRVVFANMSSADYDPRSRDWYAEGRGPRARYGPGSRWFTRTYICATSGLPCFSAVMPIHTSVPREGAVVLPSEGPGQLALPFERARVESVIFPSGSGTEMYQLRLRYSDGTTRLANPAHVRFPCDPARSCSDTVWTGNCAARCARDAAAPGVTPSAGGQSMQQRLVGVITADYESWSLTRILDSIRVGKSGGMFIVDQQGTTDTLIAVSSALPCHATWYQKAPNKLRCFVKVPGVGNVPNSSEGAQQVSAYDDYAGHIVTGVMNGLFPRKEYRTLRHHISAEVEVGGDHYWVEATPVNPAERFNISNVRWLLVIALPQDDYLAHINKHREDTMYVSIAIAVVTGIMAAVFAVGLINAPIRGLLERMELACGMRIDEALATPFCWTPLWEIRRVQRSFVTLCLYLKEYRSYLPRAVLSVDDGSSPSSRDEASESSDAHPERVPSNNSHRRPSGDSGHRRRSHTSAGSGHSGGRTVHASSSLVCTEGFRPVTVAAGNVRALHSGMLRPAFLREKLAGLLSVVSCIVGRTRGNVDGVAGDRVRLSWNAARPTGSHRPRAATAAADICSSPGTMISLAVCTGDGFCGHFGDAVFRYPAIISPVCAFAHAAERYAACGERQGAVALAEHRVRVDQPELYYRWHSKVVYAKRSLQPVTLWLIVGKPDAATLAEDQQQEWMYALAAGEAAQPFRDYNAAVVAELSGDRERAKELLLAVPSDAQQYQDAAELLQQLQAADGGARSPVDILELFDVGAGPVLAVAEDEQTSDRFGLAAADVLPCTPSMPEASVGVAHSVPSSIASNPLRPLNTGLCS